MRYISLIIVILLLTACQEPQISSSAPATAIDIEVADVLLPDDLGYIAENPRYTHLIGTPGPALTLQALDGSEVNLLDIYGQKPVYLKLWATFCIPCRVQMPGFENIYQAVGERMLVVAVNAGVGDDIGKVAEFVADEGMHMPVAIDDGSLGAWLQMQETPLSLIIGMDGRIIYAGHQDGARLHAAIEQALDKPVSAGVETTTVTRLETLQPGDAIPAIDLRRSDNTLVQLQGAAGRPQALLFTSIWCEDYLLQTEPQTARNCQRVREEVAQLAQSGNLEWLGIVSHLWTTPDSLGVYQGQVPQPLPYVIDTEGTAFRVFGIRRFPAVALIDADGSLVRIVGPDDNDLSSAVQTLSASQ